MSCLICGGGLTSVTSFSNVSDPNSPNNIGGVSSLDGIKRICLFHKILKIPLTKCIKFLEMEKTAGGQGEMTFCGGCGLLLDEGLELVGLMDKMESQMKGVQYKMMALLLHPQQQIQGKGQRKDLLRSSLIREISRRGYKFDVDGIGKMRGGRTGGNSGKVKVGPFPRKDSPGLTKKVIGQSQQVELVEEEEQNGIGIITSTSSMTASNQGQYPYPGHGGVIQETDQDQGGGQQVGVDMGNYSMMESEPPIPDRDPLEELLDKYHDESGENLETAGVDVDIICKVDSSDESNLGMRQNQNDENLTQGAVAECSLRGRNDEEDAQFSIQGHGEVMMDVGDNGVILNEGQENEEENDVEILEASKNGITYYKKEVSASVLSLYAELDAQKHSKNPNRVKVAPSTSSGIQIPPAQASTSQMTLSPLVQLPPRKIHPPLRLLEQSSDKDKYSKSPSSGGKGANSFPRPVHSIQKRKLSPKLIRRVKPYKHRNYQCLICNRICDNAKELGRHYSSDHADLTRWPCFACSRSFETRIDLYVHRKRYHKNLLINEQNSGTRPNGKVMKPNANHRAAGSLKENEVERHLEDVSPIATASRSSGVTTPSPKTNPSPHRVQRNFFCVLCDTFLPGGPQLGAHYAEAHGSDPTWGCSKCGTQFDTQKQLYFHRRDVHKNLPINQTSHSVIYGIKGGNNLAKNPSDTNETLAATASPEGSIPVPGVANSSIELIRNSNGRVKKVGSHRKSYICLLCDKDCGDNIQIFNHYRSAHNNPTEWPCFACDRVFQIKNSLYAHRRVFHKNLPTAKKAPQKSGNGLVGQLKIIADRKVEKKNMILKRRTMYNYRCVICGVDCKSGGGVASHYKLVHPTLSKCLKCSKCSKTFKSYNSLFTHKRHYHKEKERKTLVSKPSKGDEGQGYDSDESYYPD